jgi:hypothetical protein
MTSIVTVKAHCSDKKHVRVETCYENRQVQYLNDGDTIHVHVHGEMEVVVREESKE